MKKAIINAATASENGIIHAWMSARIAFALGLPFCKSNAEKLQHLEEVENTFLDAVFYDFGSKAGEYARGLLLERPLYKSWLALESNSDSMQTRHVYLDKGVYDAIRADIIALHRAGLCKAETSACGEGVYLTVTACQQVVRKISRIIAAEV